MDMSQNKAKIRQPQAVYHAILDNVEHAIKGQTEAVRLLLAAWVCGGHVLIEDYPGTGKTTLAKALARSVHLDFNRVQFTPDLLPADITGLSIFDPKDQHFHFHRGPVFTQILLADEINRASPRTQSALLEAMAENQVTIEGKTHELDSLFFVIATQNPVEFHGTYPLPEAQMDRFSIQLSLGYLSAEAETALLDNASGGVLEGIGACASEPEIRLMSQALDRVKVNESVKKYMVALVQATRGREDVDLGCSPRASLTLMNMSRALALFDGMDYVIPEHVQQLAGPVLCHRIRVNPQARFNGVNGGQIIDELLETIAVPV